MKKLKTFEAYSTDDWQIIDYDNDSGKILSVKRNSDGEIFSLGDEVAHDVPGAEYKKMGKIDRIWKSFEQMRIDIGRLGIVLNDYVKKLEEVKEEVDPLREGPTKSNVKKFNPSAKKGPPPSPLPRRISGKSGLYTEEQVRQLCKLAYHYDSTLMPFEEWFDKKKK